jgi:hypothetical protein
MRAEDLVFWLDALRPDADQSSGALCRRHADSMVVPRHWTLDDLRDPVPRLFRPPPSTPGATAAPRRRKGAAAMDSEQLLLVAETPDAAVPERESIDVTPWTPSFDESDDLDGLLSARSPLLARAFRGDDRPKPT